MGLDDEQTSTLRAPRLLHNPDRRASEGMITPPRGAMLPPITKSSSATILSSSLSRLSLTPVVNVVVNDDEAANNEVTTSMSTSVRGLRRSSSPWSKSSTPSPNSLHSVSNPILAPSPPPSSPSARPTTSSQIRTKRFIRRGSLPANSLSPSSPRTVTGIGYGRNRLTSTPEIRVQGEQSLLSSTSKVDGNSNILNRENSTLSALSKNRALSPYPIQYGAAAFRRRSEGTLNIPTRFTRGNIQETKLESSNGVHGRFNENHRGVDVGHSQRRLCHRNSDGASALENDRQKTRPQTRRNVQQVVDNERAFVPISQHDTADNDNSSLDDFDEEEDDEARQWILNWLEGVEKSTSRTPAVALDDFYRYTDSKETAIKVCHKHDDTDSSS